MRSFKHSWLILLLFVCLAGKSRGQCILVNAIPGYNCATSVCELTLVISNAQTPPPYTITSVPVGISGIITGSSISFSNIPYQANYNITISGSGTCTGFGAVLYSNPTLSNNITVTQTNVSCYGGFDGAAFSSFVGGGPYSWQWSTGSTNSVVTGLSAGVYTVSVTNGAGCIATKPFTIIQPSEIYSILIKTLIPCYGATITSAITTTGGVSPFTYTVNGIPVTAASGNVATGLMAGIQTILTRDNYGCIQTNTLLLNQAAKQIITPTITQPNCPHESNGAISVSVNGSVAGYTYSWTPGSGNSASLSNIPAGNYTLNVLDASNCITRSVITVPPAPAILPVPIIKKENCSAADGAFTLSAIGGLSPYTYTTLPGNLFGNVASGLSTGNYTIIIKDAIGCIDSSRVYLGNLSTVSLTILTVIPVKCYNTCNGSIILNTQNAVQPVTYSITGRPVTTLNLVSNLCAGLYVVKALDANGCPAFDTLNFPQPPVFSYSVASPPAICIGKSSQLKAIASGGTGPLTYLWNPGALAGATVNTTPVITTTYSLNVYDSQGCTLPPYQVTVSVNPKISIQINNSSSGICPGTTAQITPTVSGGDGNYSFLWLPSNVKGSSIFVESITIPTYTFVVKDACGSPPVSKEIDIKLHPVIQPLYKQEGKGGCSPYCTTFINLTPGSKNAIWNYGDKPFEQKGDTTFYCYTKAGNFNLRLTVTDSNSCKAAYTYLNAIKVLVKPDAGFITDPGIITLNEAEDVLIKNTTKDASSFEWYINGIYFGTKQNITYSFKNTGCYDIRLITENENQCKDSASRSICVFEGFNFYMPNAFTPNKDGLNDILLPKGTGWIFENYKLEIYNRWGHKIFSTTNFYEGWNGDAKMDASIPDFIKSDPNELYAWRVRITDTMQKEHEMRGSVTLLR